MLKWSTLLRSFEKQFLSLNIIHTKVPSQKLLRPNPTESDQIRPNPTESNQIRPNPKPYTIELHNRIPGAGKTFAFHVAATDMISTLGEEWRDYVRLACPTGAVSYHMGFGGTNDPFHFCYWSFFKFCCFQRGMEQIGTHWQKCLEKRSLPEQYHVSYTTNKSNRNIHRNKLILDDEKSLLTALTEALVDSNTETNKVFWWVRKTYEISMSRAI